MNKHFENVYTIQYNTCLNTTRLIEKYVNINNISEIARKLCFIIVDLSF